MTNHIDMPALLGGPRTVQDDYTWPPPPSRATEELVLDALRSRRGCGYAGNDAPHRTSAEHAVAERQGYRYAVACSNGTRALADVIAAELIYRGPSWCERRHIVAGPDFTWVPGTWGGIAQGVLAATRHAPTCLLVGYGSDWTVDADTLELEMRQRKDELLAVVVPSLLGNTAAIDRIARLGIELDIPVIHDGAQMGGALGSGLADWLTISFQGGKWDANVGDMGVACTNSALRAYIFRQVTDSRNVPGGALDPTGGLQPEIDLGWVGTIGNDRASNISGAVLLGTIRDRDNLLPVIRRVRRAVGTEIKAPDGTVVFVTPPIADDYDSSGPTYGFGMLLTTEAIEKYGLSADDWQAFLAAEGFALAEPNMKPGLPGYKYGIRRPYPSAGSGAYDMGRVIVPPRRRQDDPIAQRGLMVHVGWLARPDEDFPALLSQAIAKAVTHAAELRHHFAEARRFRLFAPTQARSLTGQPKPPQISLVDIGVAGCGNITRVTHAPHLTELGILPWLYDVFPEQADSVAKQFGGWACRTEEQFLRHGSQGAIIATPPEFHLQMFYKLLRAGAKHLLVEKPFALSLRQAIEALALANEQGARVSETVHQLLMAKEALDFAQAGALGPLVATDYTWRRWSESSQDPLLDLGPHAFAWAFGLKGSLPRTVTTIATGPVITVALSWPNFQATIRLESASAGEPQGESVAARIIGEDGVLTVPLRTAGTPPPGLTASYHPVISRRNAPPQYLNEVPSADETRRTQTRLWVESLSGGPGLPIRGRHIIAVQAIQDAAVKSRSTGGRSVDPRILD